MRTFLQIMFLVSVGICILQPSKISAQSTTTSVVSSEKFPKPLNSGVLRQLDPDALNELKAHVATVSSDGWTGFQGTGTITYGAESTSFNATLSAIGSSMYRLDASSKKGQTSTRIDRSIGKVQDAAGTTLPLSLDAALAGIFPFEIARTFHKSNRAASLRDDGVFTIAGQSLHRITLERSTLGVDPVAHKPNTSAIDLYFDPKTHLLLYTVAFLPVPGSRNLKLLSVVAYSDYHQIGKELVPFRFSESVDGEVVCTLQLATVQLEPVLDLNYFSF